MTNTTHNIDTLRIEAENALRGAKITFKEVEDRTNSLLSVSLGHGGKIILNLSTGRFIIELKENLSWLHKTRKKSGAGGVQSVIAKAKRIMKDIKKRERKMSAELREKAYNKETKANLLYKLQEAEKNYKAGMSMSKAARLTNVEYQAFKDYIQTDKFKVEE